MTFHDLTAEFIRHGRYLRNWSERTVSTYEQGLTALHRAIGEERCLALDRRALDAFVVNMRERGLTPGGCNMYIRTVNSFLSWLHEQEKTPTHLRVKLLPNPPKALRTFSDADARALLAFKPRSRSALRTWTLILTLMDTGLRIEEALGLLQSNVDFDNLILKVLGKGNKQRLVPFSPELRKHLFRLTAKHPGRFVFASQSPP
jgi:site-specific recombinase XerD